MFHYLHELKYLFLGAALLQEEAVRVRALEHAPRLQQLTHAVLNEACVRRSAFTWCTHTHTHSDLTKCGWSLEKAFPVSIWWKQKLECEVEKALLIFAEVTANKQLTQIVTQLCHQADDKDSRLMKALLSCSIFSLAVFSSFCSNWQTDENRHQIFNDYHF